MSLSKQRQQELNQIQDKLGIFFDDIYLLEKVFIHTSYLNENKDLLDTHNESNEKLELLGDSVLSFIIIRYLYDQYPEFNEGRLSKIKAFVVSEIVLFRISKHLDLGSYLLLGRGEQIANENREKKSILADLLEAFIGGCYLDQGLDVINDFLLPLFKEDIEKSVENEFYEDYKTKLQLIIQQRYKTCPVYETTCYQGLEHERTFFIDVLLDNEKLASGKGTSKKRAQQNAAYHALKKMTFKEE